MTGRTRDQSCVYLLTNVRVSYVGFTGQASPQAGRSALGLPSARGWQHQHDIASRRRSAALHHAELFRRDPEGLLRWCFVKLGGSALERTLIRMCRPTGNTVHALQGGWRRPADLAPVQPGRRHRPPPRLRHSQTLVGHAGPLEAALSRLPQAVAQWILEEGRTLGAVSCGSSASATSMRRTLATMPSMRMSPSGRWTSATR